MLQVNFYETIEDSLLEFAVIVSKYKGKWVFCKHRNRDTYEVPGGHREEKEEIDDTAKRELYEETGATSYELHKVCVYSVVNNDILAPDKEESYGMLYCAEIKEFGELPEMEMERVEFFDAVPENLTYPLIQPVLMKKILELTKNNAMH
jgi:8-oxo-dGTP diphosphatase